MAIILEQKSPIGRLVIPKIYEMGKTQSWLAKEMNCTNNYLGRIFDGKIKNPSFDMIIKMSVALNISLEEFSNAINKTR